MDVETDVLPIGRRPFQLRCRLVTPAPPRGYTCGTEVSGGAALRTSAAANVAQHLWLGGLPAVRMQARIIQSIAIGPKRRHMPTNEREDHSSAARPSGYSLAGSGVAGGDRRRVAPALGLDEFLTPGFEPFCADGDVPTVVVSSGLAVTRGFPTPPSDSVRARASRSIGKWTSRWRIGATAQWS